MLPVARMYDSALGVCTAHKDPVTEVGYVISSQMTVLVNGLAVVRMMDTVISGCGAGSGIIITGSGTVLCGGLPMARMTDSFVGSFSGTIINGSSNVLCG